MNGIVEAIACRRQSQPCNAKRAIACQKKPPLARVEARSPGVRAGEETSETMNLLS
ncbi:hypothetical protein F2Q69_00043215 [Brassica cretica]|uniref:Uncharacterized protein n=1 Tax=Brassica cretica TaxID=69181 RepID=A0A8S9NR94_BRACR|nr:hypothetical protein F2Q69_00043215 [Brassica cretica]